ncbi:hypothetical protein SIID45300_01439 [Candidatus Magnetaquicoccaceae bacterium FCR-1]|uniref:Uncharacterized protein n=1 Tax=Candidatus Magnetaquiglobus chichijimensis TaxID=3141448 RepID=A0ABQ0C8A5_9PROT
MKFEILVEGVSDKTTLWDILPAILGPREQPHLWFIRKHQGIGKLPENLVPRQGSRTTPYSVNFPQN